jgi:hypothetical protein
VRKAESKASLRDENTSELAAAGRQLATVSAAPSSRPKITVAGSMVCAEHSALRCGVWLLPRIWILARWILAGSEQVCHPSLRCVLCAASVRGVAESVGRLTVARRSRPLFRALPC